MGDAQFSGDPQALLGALNGDKPAPRTITRLTVPTRITSETGDATRTISVKLLTIGEEKMVADKSGESPASMAYAQATHALVAINDRPVSMADGSAERAFAAMHPRVRALITLAVQRMHGVAKEDVDSFLQSQVVTSG